MASDEEPLLSENQIFSQYGAATTGLEANTTMQDDPAIGVSSQTLVSENEGVQGRKLPQYIAALAVTLGAFATGTTLSWTAPTKESIENGDMGFPVDGSAFGWVGSLMTLGAATICFPIAFGMDLIGRKLAMLLLIIPFTLGWCLIIWANSLPMLYCGRYITGMAGGAFCVSAPLYTSEIAEKEIRGTLGSYFQLMVTVGILFVYVVGSLTTITVLSIICMCVPLVFGVCFFFQPETPVYYVMSGKIDAARKSLQHFRGTHYNVDRELLEIIANNEERRQSKLSLSLFTTKPAIKSIFISFGLMVFQQLSGINAVIFYATDIFSDAGASISASNATIIVGVMQVVATFVASLVIDKLGRRILLLISDFVMAVCSIVLGVYFYLSNETDTDVTNIGFLPILSLCLFIIVFSLGYGPIPWMMVGEVVPKEIKSLVTSMACTFNWILAFLVTKFFLDLKTAMKQHGVFWLFGGISLVGTVFVFLVVPETKGKSLEQIQRELSGEPRVIHPAGAAQENQGYTKNDNL